VTGGDLPWMDGLAGELADVGGVVGVALGGSRARGTHAPDSDVDVGLFYAAASPIDVAAVRRVAERIDDGHAPDEVSGIGEWGPWIDGGARLRVGGLGVDLLYRETGLVGRVVELGRRGVFKTDYQPGHPHGFHSYILAGEAHHNRPLRDPVGALAELRQATFPYPPALRRSVVERFRWEAGFVADAIERSAHRLDPCYLAGSLFRFAACLTQVVFAASETYFVNEKGSLRQASALPGAPRDLAARVEELFGRTGAHRRRLAGELRGLLSEVVAAHDRTA
jgi:hypothetical protein